MKEFHSKLPGKEVYFTYWMLYHWAARDIVYHPEHVFTKCILSVQWVIIDIYLGDLFYATELSNDENFPQIRQ